MRLHQLLPDPSCRIPKSDMTIQSRLIWKLPMKIMAPNYFVPPNAVFYLADPVKGMFGFSRDGYMNTFAFRPYPGEKISVKITGDALSTSLFINGQLIERMGIEKRYLNEAEKQNNFIRTLVFPLKNAGNFKSKITNLKVYNRLCSHGTRAKTDRH